MIISAGEIYEVVMRIGAMVDEHSKFMSDLASKLTIFTPAPTKVDEDAIGSDGSCSNKGLLCS